MNNKNFVGCCGAYCRTCKPYRTGACRGCTTGYGTGGRDITRAKCTVKVCCFGEKGYYTCADCPGLDTCEIVGGFYGKNGYKYKKYREAVMFIREHGYKRFIAAAEGWKGPYGRLS